MALTLDPERRELRAVARDFFTDLHDEAALRRAIDSERGYEEATWRRLAEQLGAQGIAVPEAYGGVGFTHLDLGLVLEQAGAALYTGPLASSVVVADVLAHGDETLAKELVPRVVEHAAPAAFALVESAGGWFTAPRHTTATASARGVSLTGRKIHVLDAQHAELLLVSADHDGREALFAVETDQPGVTVDPVPTMDPTRRQGVVTLRDAVARPLAPAADPDLADRLRSVAVIHQAAEQVGGAARALEMAVTYTRAREQYGRPIGSFQALKHLCADHAAAIETARSAVLAGLEALDTDAPDLVDLAGAAKVFCSETFTAAAASCIQIHGGIGFTWEHPAHFYYKRARTTEMLCGTPSAHRAVLAARLGL